MKLATMFAALPLLAALAWPQEPAPTAGAASKVAAKKTAPRKAPRISRADSLRNAGLKAKLDSLLRLDSLHRSDSLRAADSLARFRTAWREDSLRKADSLRHADSLERAGRTWYVTRVRDLAGSSPLSRSLQESLRRGLVRRGGVFLGDTAGRDTAGTFEDSWRAGLASGSGKLLYTALRRTPDSTWTLSGWVFEIATGAKLDSAAIPFQDTSSRGRDAWVGELVRRLLPTPEQARCLADSVAQARTLWALEIPVNHVNDTALTSRLRFGFRDAFAASGRGRSLFLKDSVYCPTRGCLDTLAGRLEAHRVLQTELSRAADSSWHLVVVASKTSPDSLIDSFLVTSPRFEGLVAKAISLLLPPPSSCRTLCQRPQPDQERLVWSVDSVLSDSVRASDAAALGRELERGLAADPRHQFVPRELAGRKSHPRAVPAGQWIDRKVEVRLEGSGSRWIFRAVLRDARSGFVLDTLRLTRGGHTPRVFAWFARKLSDALHVRTPSCANPCREDSLRLAASPVLVTPPKTAPGDTSSAPRLSRLLVEKLQARGTRAHLLPDSLSGPAASRLDETVRAMGATRILRWGLDRTPDSVWRLSGTLTEPGIDTPLDSVAALEDGPLADVLPALVERLAARFATKPLLCDTCVSRDTLEAGLALIEPQWKDVTDTLQTLFVDSLRGVLAREGRYQVLPMSLTDPVHPSSGVSCDSVCRRALVCRTGATAMVTSSLSRDGSGWMVKAQLVDLRTGKVLSQMSSREHRNDVQRLREIAPWVGRKLTGTDSAAVAPSSRRSLGIPWGKIVALALPVTAGLISVVSRW